MDIKKLVSKFVATGIAMILALIMCIPALAISPDATGVITISGLEKGVTVKAYKIIETNIDITSGQPKDPVYKWIGNIDTPTTVAGWVKSNYSSYIETNGNGVTDDFENLSTNDVTVFSHALELAIKRAANEENKNNIVSIEPSKSVVSTETSVELTGLTMGQYLIAVSDGKKIYTSTTVNLIPVYKNDVWQVKNAEINMKGEEPNITKEIVNPADKTVAIGDTVKYQLTVLVPDYPENATARKLEVGDNLGTSLDLVSTSIKVTTDEDAKNDILNGYYTLQTTLKNDSIDNFIANDSFKITFTDDFLKNPDYAGQTIYITYSATINETAFVDDGLDNKAYIGYNRDPYDEKSYTEKTDEEKVFTYGIEITKVNDYDNEEDKEILSGAKFTLSKEETSTVNLKFIKIKDGVYRIPTEEEIEADKELSETEKTISEILQVNSSGKLQIQGLDTGNYVLTEIVAPNGYVVPNGTITINLADTDANGTADESTIDTTGTAKTGAITANGNVITFDVVNHDNNFNLPLTGGMGTLIFTVAGIALMAGAVVIFYTSRKRKTQD